MKAWKIILLVVVLGGAAFAAYWFYFRKRKAAAPSAARQLNPTYNYVPPAPQTIGPSMPTGAPRAQPATQFLNQIGGTATKAAEQAASKLAQTAAAKIGDVASNAVSNLFSSWSN